MFTKESRFKSHISGNLYLCNKLKELGISMRYTGFYYLLDILDIIINNEMQVKSFSVQVYPIVASRYNASVCTIERNIRSLIKNNFDEALKTKLNAASSKITCCGFIKLIVRYILKEIQ